MALGGRRRVLVGQLSRAAREGDLAGAEQLLRPLAGKGLTWPYGMLMLTSGLARVAEACFHRSTLERPYLTVAWEMLMWARLIVGDGPGAIEAGRQIVRLYPETAINSAALLGHALAGDLSAAGKARADLERRIARLPQGPQRRLTERALARLAFLLSQRCGQTDEARQPPSCSGSIRIWSGSGGGRPW